MIRQVQPTPGTARGVPESMRFRAFSDIGWEVRSSLSDYLLLPLK